MNYTLVITVVVPEAKCV